MPQFRKRERDERAAEVLRQKTAIEVADEDAVDVTRLESGRLQRRLDRFAHELFRVDGVELAEVGVAPADDVRLIHVCDPCDVFEMGEAQTCVSPFSAMRRRSVGRPTPAASNPPSTASTCPLMKLDSSPHRKPTALAISSVVP